jgi:hypothetical protein
VTARCLETMIRLSTAHAKVSQEANLGERMYEFLQFRYTNKRDVDLEYCSPDPCPIFLVVPDPDPQHGQ